MPSDVTRSEFDHLRGRVDVVEREVEGEKMVTRYILEQTRRNGENLATVLERLGGLEDRLGGLAGRLGGVEGRLGRVEQELQSLAKSLPTIVADAVRDVLRERGGRI